MRRFIWALVLLFALIPAPTFSPNAQLYAQSQGSPSVRVWVNTASGVYHCPGTRWYGATKHGQYMTQKEALANGNRPAYGKYCQ